MNSSFFEKVLFPHQIVNKSTKIEKLFKIQFLVLAQCVDSSQSVYVSGNILELGNWNLKNALALDYVGNGFWALDLQVEKNNLPFEYKYLITNKTFEQVLWEDGANRIFHEVSDIPFKTQKIVNSPKTITIRSSDIFRVSL